VIGVSKKYVVGYPTSRPRAKKYWFLYFYDENGKFHSKRISNIQALYYKSRKFKKVRKVVCYECGNTYQVVGDPFCPNCEKEIQENES